jgi:hypothetical protein
MTTKQSLKSHHERKQKVILLEGLDERNLAAIARDYERKTGREFRCQQCMETGRGHSLRDEAEADEPGIEVVAILEESTEPIPLCEDCYKRLMDSTRTL